MIDLIKSIKISMAERSHTEMYKNTVLYARDKSIDQFEQRED